MNETMKIYEEHLERLEKHLAETMSEIETIQRQSVVLDEDSRELISELMDHYSRTNTIITCFAYKLKDYKKKVSRRDKA